MLQVRFRITRKKYANVKECINIQLTHVFSPAGILWIRLL